MKATKQSRVRTTHQKPDRMFATRKFVFITLLCASLFITGCTSPDTTFITLTPQNSRTDYSQTRAKQSAKSAPVIIGKITLPPELDRLALVKLQDNSRVQVQEFAQWAAPLGQLIKRTLTQDLSALLADTNVLPPNAPVPDKCRIIEVYIAQFSADQNNKVTLKTHWFAVNSKSQKVIQKGAKQITTQAQSSDPGDIATAMSAALCKLAVAIVKSM